MVGLNWTGERLVTQLDNLHGVVEHLHRYSIAQGLSKGKIVLDIASGEGYGSALISNNATKVIGIDIDEESISHAKEKYKSRHNLEYKVGSTSNIPITDNSVDFVVSFETLEHHDEHNQMMSEIKRVLKPGGMLLISSPEKSIYKKRDSNNPYHIKELELAELEILLKSNFKFVEFFSQIFLSGSLITPIDNSIKSDIVFYSGTYTEIEYKLSKDEFYNEPFFNLALCSNEPINRSFVQRSIFDGVNVIKAQISTYKDKYEKIINYKLCITH